MIMENNTSSYIQLSHPDAGETGILSGNVTLGSVRSGVIFAANNSVQVRSGGNVNRLYIDNGGYTGVNRTPTPAFNTGTLQVQNVSSSDDILGLYSSSTGNHWTYYLTTDLFMYYNGTTRGSWSSVNGVYTSFSDRRLKKDIQPLGSVLSSITRIQPYSFRYNDNAGTDPLTIGFMAQDVQPLFPEAVKELTNKDGTKNLGIQYQYMSVYAIKAIQEQQQMIDSQNKRIAELEKIVQKLNNK
jgi:hypothetical protein